MNLKKVLTLALAVCGISPSSLAQSKDDIAALAAQSPKCTAEFPLNYHIVLPRQDMQLWDEDYNSFKHFITPAIEKTQQGLSYGSDSMVTWMCVPSARPHAQLDTATLIADENKLQGTWRSISFRRIRFRDSVSFISDQIYRSDTLLAVQQEDDAFVTFGDKQFRMYVKEKGKKSFKRKTASRYQLESGRFLMLYQVLKSGSGISQVGIDADGRLLIHHAAVIEENRRGKYINYVAVIEQMIFERVPWSF